MRGIINKIGAEPTRAMEAFVGFLFLVDGLYVASPLYYVGPASPLVDFANDRPFQIAMGITYALFGLVGFVCSVWGHTLKVRRVAAMALFLVSFFSFLFRFGALGPHPSGWAFNLMLAGVFVCDWLYINKSLPSLPQKN